MDPQLVAVVTNIEALTAQVENATAAARTIKNAIVGNPTKKQLYIDHGVLPRLVSCVNSTQTQPVLGEHAVAALGSLAPYIPTCAILDVTTALFRALFCTHTRAVHAAVRALKLLVCTHTHDSLVFSDYFVTDQVANRLVVLLSAADEGIAEVCAVIVGHTTQNSNHANTYVRASIVPALVTLLTRTLHERCMEECVYALAALARHSNEVSSTLTSPHCILSTLVQLSKTPLYSLRLASCRLLTIFHTADRLPAGLDTSVTIAVVKLLSISPVSALSSIVETLTELVIQNPYLQRVATDSGAIIKLATFLVPQEVSSNDLANNDSNVASLKSRPYKRPFEHRDTKSLASSPPIDQYGDYLSPLDRSDVLSALAALMDEYDPARDAVIAQNILPVIVDGLSDSNYAVVRASLRCIRALSRSVKILRKDIAKECLGEHILRLLDSDDESTRHCASATICNLVLEFSSMRTVILKKGGVDTLIRLLSSSDTEVRKNSLWALKNLLFKADADTKTTVLSSLGFDCLSSLVVDSDATVRGLAMTVLRNLAYSSTMGKQIEQLDALFAMTGKGLAFLLSQILEAETVIDLAVQALYVVCNIASGAERHKAYLFDSNIPSLVLRWTNHRDERARIAAVWCAINLSWKEQELTPNCGTRTLRRALRESRTNRELATERLDTLRRQHLPVPSSPQGRRILERYTANIEGSRTRNVTGDRPAGIGANVMGAVENGVDLMADDDTNSNQNGATNDDSVPGFLEGPSHESGRENEMVDDDSDLSNHDRNNRTDDRQPDAIGDNGTTLEITSGPTRESPTLSKSSGHAWRIERLRQLGFERRLRVLTEDPHIEVQGRARAALEMFDSRDTNLVYHGPSTEPDVAVRATSRVPRVPHISFQDSMIGAYRLPD